MNRSYPCEQVTMRNDVQRKVGVTWCLENMISFNIISKLIVIFLNFISLNVDIFFIFYMFICCQGDV